MGTMIIKTGLVSLLVCTDQTDEEAATFANQTAPTGISSGWVLAEDKPGDPNMGPCESLVGHRHVKLVC